MEAKYAGMSPYNYAFNNPVIWNYLSGADPNNPDDPPKTFNGKPVKTEVTTYEDGTRTSLYGYNPRSEAYDILLDQQTMLREVESNFEKAKNFWGQIWGQGKEIAGQVSVFLCGVANAYSSNNLLGVGRVDPKTAPSKYYNATLYGQIFGDILV